MILILLAIISFFGGAVASVLLRLLVSSGIGRNSNKISGKDERSESNEKSLQEAGKTGQDQAKVHGVEIVRTQQVQGGKKKKRSRHSKQEVQESDRTGQQPAKDSENTASNENVREDGNAKEGSVEEIQQKVSKQDIQGTSKGSLDQPVKDDTDTAPGKGIKKRSNSQKELKKNAQSKGEKKDIEEPNKTVQSQQEISRLSVQENVGNVGTSIGDAGVQHTSGQTLAVNVGSEPSQYLPLGARPKVYTDRTSRGKKPRKTRVKLDDWSSKHYEDKADVPIQAAKEYKEGIEKGSITAQTSEKPVDSFQVEQKHDGSATDDNLDVSQQPDWGKVEADESLAVQEPGAQVEQSPSIKGKKPIKAAVKLDDWSSKHYEDKDDVPIQAAKEYKEGIEKGSVTVQTSEKPVDDPQVWQKHDGSTTDDSLDVSQQPDCGKIGADESLAVQDLGTQFESVGGVFTQEEDIVSAVEQLSLDELGAAVRVNPTVFDQSMLLEESSLGIQEEDVSGVVKQVPAGPSGQCIQKSETIVSSEGAGIFNTHIKSVGVSEVGGAKGKKTLHKNMLPKFVKSVKPSGEEDIVVGANFEQQICVLRAIHLEYCRSISRELFEQRKGKVFIKKGIMSFIKRAIPDKNTCTFIFKFAYMLTCMEVMNQPEIANSIICNAYLFSNQSLFDQSITQVIQCMQSTASFEQILKVLSNCCVEMANSDHQFYDGKFFRNVLDVLQRLMLFRLVDTSCPKQVVDLAIVKCAMIIGDMYANYMCFVKSQGKFVNEEGIRAIIEHMGVMVGGGDQGLTQEELVRFVMICWLT